MDEPGRVGLAAGERHRERVDDELGVLMRPCRPANQAAVAEIPDAGEIEGAFVCCELGDVGDPALIRPLGFEVALQHVRGGRDLGPSAPPLAPRIHAHEPAGAHQPRDPLAADPDPTAAELPLHAEGAIGAARLPVDPLDLDHCES